MSLLAPSLFIWRARRCRYCDAMIFGVVTGICCAPFICKNDNNSIIAILIYWLLLSIAFWFIAIAIVFITGWFPRKILPLFILSIPIFLEIFGYSNFSDNLLRTFGNNNILIVSTSIFGSLAVFFLIIYLNSILAISLEKSNRIILQYNYLCPPDDGFQLFHLIEEFASVILLLTADNRAPPRRKSISLLCNFNLYHFEKRRR
ncbi:membrane hypothetical protein [Candidatus Zixiibacteriota bacterium]|nr:membrane hypothetical protein [candidate division Zixibacteria bacterium]